MMTMSKSLVARAALGLVALAGVVAAVPASARPYDHFAGPGWRHDRVIVEPGYRPVAYGYGYGYAPAWRPAPVVYGYGPAWHPAPVVVWHAHYGRRW
ncbi:hypothetical protein [Novosphingobium sp. FSW06-99]|uniref:hypothetical protein n=1 Tax=Novosphingobium sp. FSW06-99 TaxID=1739113 RepID=UPI00076DDB79|nr:hypothetical protein [Novosphingobium sp. FSW06-99]KUR78120.1 hypothetical protein AQZ49_08890 [Novosphingobium sp. FSW06-99]